MLVACHSNQAVIPYYNSIEPSEVGIDFKHFNGHVDRFKYPEIMGAGVAAFDYDLDGDLDLYFVQSGINNESDQMYKSLLTETGKLSFLNVTKKLKLKQTSYGIGVSIGDYDNDGYPDIYLSNWQNNTLLKNHNGDYFEDVTVKTNSAGGDKFSVISAFADLNSDGWLDIVSLNNIKYNKEFEPQCQMQTGMDYCGPSSYRHDKNIIFQNNAGFFSRVSEQQSYLIQPLPSLALAIFDANQDGAPDIYIANDEKVNTLWVNEGGFQFNEQGLLSGLAVNAMAKVEASMGIAIGDIDNNGLLDLYLTHMWQETNTLYMQNGPSLFTDLTSKYSLAQSSFLHTGFGTQFLDFENDGDLDIVIANGSVMRTKTNDYKTAYSEVNLFYENLGDHFKQLDNTTSLSHNHKKNSRGLVRADLDNDGDSDIVISNNNDIPEIYLNQQTFNNNWIGYVATNELEHLQENIESQVLYEDKVIASIQTRTGSYASSSDPRVLLGLGGYSGDIEVIVRWNKFTFEKFRLTPNRYHKLIKGKGEVAVSWVNIEGQLIKDISSDKEKFTLSITDLLNEPISEITKKHIRQLMDNKLELDLCYSVQSYEFINEASLCYAKYFATNTTIDSDTLYLAALNEINKFDYQLAMDYLDQASLINQNDNWYFCYRKVQVYLLGNELGRAESLLKKCMSIDENAYNYKLWGDILFAQKKYKSAFKQYRQALILEPNANHLYYQLAESLKHFETQEMEELALSKAGIRKLVLADPVQNKLVSYNHDPDFHYEKSLLANLNENFPSALYAMQRAFELAPEDEKIYKNYALLLAKNNQIEKALQVLSSKLTFFLEAETYLTYGSLLSNSNNVTQAQSIYLKGLEKFPNNMNLLTNLANNFLRLNQLQQAQENYKKILIFEPTNENALNGLKVINKKLID